MNPEPKSGPMKSLRTVLLAGLTGGMAEVVWVTAYSAVNGVDGWQMAREISAAVVPGWAQLAVAPLIGLGIHFLLSVLLAGAFTVALWIPYLRHRTAFAVMVAGPLTLAGVWAMNFLVILPALHPAFVHLLPFPVSLGSKILFGLAMSAVLRKRESVVVRSASSIEQ